MSSGTSIARPHVINPPNPLPDPQPPAFLMLWVKRKTSFFGPQVQGYFLCGSLYAFVATIHLSPTSPSSLKEPYTYTRPFYQTRWLFRRRRGIRKVESPTLFRKLCRKGCEYEEEQSWLQNTDGPQFPESSTVLMSGFA
ncbi:hypothetical protein L2E82_45387 [Cichorium intybus]|uniref:Uncharacterized protein n=1 Tax=Cichorium intybus TaxID=13427 RepID=A0ACB8ZTU7_CICIN|nr:hypothetical protein L2E82_45387 [Cichorium intybus]